MTPEPAALLEHEAVRKLTAALAEVKRDLASERERRRHAETVLLETESLHALWNETADFHARKLAKRAAKPSKAAAILCCNDWHAEERIDPRTVNDLNEFDLDICTKRVDTLWQKALRMLDVASGLSKLDELVVWLGGDLINGFIHEELQEANFLGPAEAVSFVEGLIHTGLTFLLEHSNLPIRVVCSIGNHGRSTAKTRHTTGYRSSWEWLAYQHLARLFAKDKRVAFVCEPSYHTYQDVAGRVIRFHHGDNIKYQGGVGGIAIPVNKAISQWNKSKRADWDVFGHWHQPGSCGRWTACNCLVGFNAHAVAIKADFYPPSQMLLVVSQKYGVVLETQLFVEEPRNA